MDQITNCYNMDNQEESQTRLVLSAKSNNHVNDALSLSQIYYDHAQLVVYHWNYDEYLKYIIHGCGQYCRFST